MIAYRQITNVSDYFDQRYFFILFQEESGIPKLEPYLDSRGVPTIGVGFNLRVPANQSVIFAALGVTSLATQAKLISAFSKTYGTTADLRQAIYAIFPQFQFANEAQLRSVFDQIANQRETDLTASLAGLGQNIPPNSSERIALMSLAWTNPNLIGDKLYGVLQRGNRAEAWFEIRYNSNLGATSLNPPADAAGLANRRYRESDLFGLFNDPLNVSEADAREALGMYTNHLADIKVYEGLYSPTNVNAGSQTIEAWLRDADNTMISIYGINGGPTIEAGLGRVLLGNDQTVKYFGRRGQVVVTFNADDELVGSPQNDLILGEGGNDQIFGQAGDNVIYGGAGNDNIRVSDGNSYLSGGPGADTYQISGTGTKHLIDASLTGDHVLYVEPDGTVRDITGTFFSTGAQNTWTSIDGKSTITHQSPYTITDNATGAQIVVDNFVDGDFGIYLLDRPGSDTTPTNVVDGTSFNDNGTEQGGITYASLTGTATADLMHGFLGDDSMNGGDSEDLLFGDEGRDSMAGAVGDDTLQGGADGDIEYGMDGNDVLVGDVLVNGDLQATMQAAIDSTAAPGTVKEFLNGGAGNDVLIGGTGNDALSGSDGIDTLIGGSGDDVIWGDGDMLATSLDWFTDGVTFVNVGGFIPPAGVGGADTIYGGGGNDRIYAEAGDDYVDAGAGNDELIGHDGNDTIFGGAGDDILDGDSNFADQAHSIPDSMHGDDYIDGGDGNDELVGNGGSDTLFGGAGNDVLFGDRS